MKPTVLFVDEEKIFVQHYIDVLDLLGCEVVHCRTTDCAFEQAEKSRVSLIVLDVMMPAGSRYRNRETQGNLKTGVFVYDDLRKLLPSVPIVVLTNVTNPGTVAQLKAIAKVTGHVNLRILRKPDYDQFAFGMIVAEILNLSTEPIQRDVDLMRVDGTNYRGTDRAVHSGISSLAVWSLAAWRANTFGAPKARESNMGATNRWNPD